MLIFPITKAIILPTATSANMMKQFFHSRGDPNLDEVGSPRTKRCQQSYRKRRSAGQSKEKTGHAKKIQRLSNLEVSDFIVKEEIETETEVLAVANEQRQEGKKDLANFVLSRTSKSLNDLIEQTWKMRKASLTQERQKLPAWT